MSLHEIPDGADICSFPLTYKKGKIHPHVDLESIDGLGLPNCEWTPAISKCIQQRGLKAILYDVTGFGYRDLFFLECLENLEKLLITIDKRIDISLIGNQYNRLPV